MKRCYLNLLILLLAVSSLAFAPGQNDARRIDDTVKAAAEADRIRSEERDDTLFYDAIRVGDLAWIKHLVRRGFAVNSKDVHERRTPPPLLFAAFCGREAVFNYLLSKGARTDDTDDEGKTALHWAAATGLVGSAKKLLARKPDLGKRDLSGNTVLATACEWREYLPGNQDDRIHGSIVALLLKARTDANSRNGQGRTPLMLAARNGSIACVQALLEHGADVHLTDTQNNSALLLAADFGYTDVVETLVSHGAEVNATNLRGDTALMLAAENGDALAVRLLLKHGADMQKKDRKGHTALDRGIRVNVGALLGAEIPLSVEAASDRASEVDYALYALILADLRRDRGFDSWRWSQGEGGAGPLVISESVPLQDFEAENMAWEAREDGMTVLPAVLADAVRRNRKAVSLQDFPPRFEARVFTRQQVDQLYAKEAPTKENPWGDSSARCILEFSLPGYSATGDTAIVFFHFADGREHGGGSGTFFLRRQDGIWQVASENIGHYL